MSSLAELNECIVGCTKCPRLTVYREEIGRVKKRMWQDWEYWAKPVPGFGDPNAKVLLLGLAPGAHGSNRTGRPFTGDGSGKFLYPVLHATGFASQPIATDVGDGMKLKHCYITSVIRCAPPGNKPERTEIENCRWFLDAELAALKKLRVVVALGKIGFEGYLDYLQRTGIVESKGRYTFAHGAEYKMPNRVVLLASYHPSLQNTNTGKLTEPMFRRIFLRARDLAGIK
ncbi:MAG TPA: uracil-DNA glycosylase [Terriglobales bacterium]